MLINSQHSDRKKVRRRLLVALLIILIMMLILMLRMVWLQITHYEKYQELADGNRIRVEPIAPSRGRILDRNGIILADNQTVYVLELHRDNLPRPRTRHSAPATWIFRWWASVHRQAAWKRSVRCSGKCPAIAAWPSW